MTNDSSPLPTTDPQALPTRDPLAVLWEPATIRLRCAAVTQAVQEGLSGWFTLNRAGLESLARELAASWRDREPPALWTRGADNPWALWAALAPQRLSSLNEQLSGQDPMTAARARADLSVLTLWLGDSPGGDWSFEDRADRAISGLARPVQRQQRDDLLALLDQASGAPAPAPPSTQGTAGTGAQAPRISGTAGLALAVLQAFQDGVFSAHETDPLRVDARVLTQLDAAALRAIFQSGSGPALPGLQTRVDHLRRLGHWLEKQVSPSDPWARPCKLLDDALLLPERGSASGLLRLLARRLAPVEPDGRFVLGLPAGDVGPHRWAGAQTAEGPHPATAGWVPLHLRSRRLVLALAEPLRHLAVTLVDLQALPAGGDIHQGHVFLQREIVLPRAARDLTALKKPHDEWVTEWRALTTSLMDELACLVRLELGLGEAELPVITLVQHPLLMVQDRPVVALEDRPATS